jgi:hypothetical protein
MHMGDGCCEWEQWEFLRSAHAIVKNSSTDAHNP